MWVRRILVYGVWLIVVFALTGCGSIRYLLPQHSASSHGATIKLVAGQRLSALSTPTRLPVPGGFELGLVSEDTSVVRVERRKGVAGAATYSVIGVAPGATTLHYVNRFTFWELAATTETLPRLREQSLEAFTVVVLPTEAAE